MWRLQVFLLVQVLVVLMVLSVLEVLVIVVVLLVIVVVCEMQMMLVILVVQIVLVKGEDIWLLLPTIFWDIWDMLALGTDFLLATIDGLPFRPAQRR